MKKFTAIILVIGALCAVLPLSAKIYRHEFGTIAENGGTVSHMFSLNPPASETSITHVFPGCPCVKADYDKRPLKAGVPVSVTAHFDPERQKGHFTKSIYIYYKGERRDTIMLTGTVMRKDQSPEDNPYPAEFGMGLCLRSATVDLGRVKAGATTVVDVPLANSYEAGMKLDLRPCGPDSAMVAPAFGLMLPPLAESRVRLLIYVPDGAPRRTLRASLMPVINGKEVTPIPLRGQIIR